MSFKQFLCEHKMAALNKCNPAQLLILHIIKFLIYTLCFRGPTHNSLVLNSRGIKTNARWAPGRRHLPGLTVPAALAGRKAREEVRGRLRGPGWDAGEPWEPGPAPQATLPALPLRKCLTGSILPFPGRAHAHTGTHPAHTHQGGRAGLRDAQASLADIFLWEDFKRAVKARNYTGYKLWNPWPARGPLPTSDPATQLHIEPGTHQMTKHTRRQRGEMGGGPVSLLTRGPLLSWVGSGQTEAHGLQGPLGPSGGSHRSPATQG